MRCFSTFPVSEILSFLLGSQYLAITDYFLGFQKVHSSLHYDRYYMKREVFDLDTFLFRRPKVRYFGSLFISIVHRSLKEYSYLGILDLLLLAMSYRILNILSVTSLLHCSLHSPSPLLLLPYVATYTSLMCRY